MTRRTCAAFALLLALGTAGAHAQAAAAEREALAILNPARAVAAREGAENGAKATRAALEEITRRFGPGHWARAYALDDLARVEFSRRRFDDALKLSTDAQEAIVSSLGPTHPRLAYFKSTRAFLNYAAGRCDDAQLDYASAYELYRTNEGPQSERALATASTLANLLITTGDTFAAEQLLLRVFDGAQSQDPRADLFQASLAIARGELAQARALLERAAKAAPAGSAQARAITLEQARLAFITSDLAGADRYLRTLTSAGDRPDLEAEHLRALVNGLRGRFAEAQAGYQRVLAGYGQQLSDDAPPMAYAHYNAAWTNRLLGDYSRSLLYFDKALGAADRCMGPESALAAAIYLERSGLYLEVNRLTDALADADRGLKIAERPSFDPVRRAYAIATRGFALKRIGRVDEAEKLFRDAIAALSHLQGADSSDLAPGYVALAEIALLRGQHAEVVRSASEALRIRRLHGAETFWGSGAPLSLLAAAHAKQGSSSEFWRYALQLRSLVLRRLQIGPGSSEVVLRELRNSRELVERVLDSAPETNDTATRGRNSDKFDLLQLPHLSELSATGGRLGDTLGAQQPGLRELLTQRSRLQEDLQAARAHLENAASPTRPRGSSEDAERHLARVAQLEAQIATLGDTLQKQFPRAADLMSPGIESAASIQRRLAKHEALYLQVVTPQALHGALLTREGLFIRSSDLGRAALRRGVSTLRRALDLATPLARRLPYDHALARELYDKTLGQFSAELAGKTELYVVPDDAMQSLPFGALVIGQPPAGGAPIPPDHFLIERFAITVLPSANALHAGRALPGRRNDQPFIGFGNPVLAGTTDGPSRSTTSIASQSASGGVADLNALTPLPDTDRELAELARVLRANRDTIHSGPAATEAAVKSTNLEPYRVIAFATHGLMAGEFRGLAQPALVLTPPRTPSATDDGLLTVSEIVQLRMSADIVLLSACNTGRDDAGGGAVGLSALARAFLYAGARSVLVSHWSVSSEATVPLITGAMERMVKPGVTRARALQESMIAMLRGESGAQYREPAFWAPFVLAGENAAASADQAVAMSAGTPASES
jgi:CHAT domain-containing protein